MCFQPVGVNLVNRTFPILVVELKFNPIHAVRLVYLRCLDRGEVYLCGYLRVVPHGSADDVDGHVAGLGDACPTVAGDIEGEGR